jgi:hypothetical protein
MSIAQLRPLHTALFATSLLFHGCQPASEPQTEAQVEESHTSERNSDVPDRAEPGNREPENIPAPSWEALATRYESMADKLDSNEQSDRFRLSVALFQLAAGNIDEANTTLDGLDAESLPKTGLVGPIAYLADRGQFDEALSLCTQRLSPKEGAFSQALCAIAQSKAKSGDLQGAKVLLAKTPDLESGTAMNAFETLGKCAIEAEDTETAYDCYARQAEMGGIGLVGSLADELSVRFAEEGDWERAVEVVARCQGDHWARAHDKILELASPDQLDSLEQAVEQWMKSRPRNAVQTSFPMTPVTPEMQEENKNREAQKRDAAMAKLEAFAGGESLDARALLEIASAGKLKEVARLLAEADPESLNAEDRRRIVFRALEMNQPDLARQIASKETDPMYRALHQVLIGCVENDRTMIEKALQTIASFEEDRMQVGLLCEIVESARWLDPVVTPGSEQVRRLAWGALDILDEVDDADMRQEAALDMVPDILPWHRYPYRRP